MEICNEHDIVFLTKQCPVCLANEQMEMIGDEMQKGQDKIDELEDKIQELQEENKDLLINQN